MAIISKRMRIYNCVYNDDYKRLRIVFSVLIS